MAKTRSKHSKARKGGKHKKTRKVYSESDYNSGDGMLTSVWGPSLWHYLHTMSFNYPPKPTPADKKHYKAFMINLKHVLPCKYCRINLRKNYKHMPIKDCHLKNRETFSRYVYELHEHINKMLKKRSGLTYCQVRERYEHFRARCTQKQITKKVFNYKKMKGKKGNGKEKGCTEPLYGKKSKCIIKIVPQSHNAETFQMDKRCKKTRKRRPRK